MMQQAIKEHSGLDSAGSAAKIPVFFRARSQVLPRLRQLRQGLSVRVIVTISPLERRNINALRMGYLGMDPASAPTY